jgi:hypothetical protein
LILPGEIAFGKAEVVDGVKQIGLPDAITAANAYDPFPKAKSGLFIVLKLHQRYLP